MTGSLSSGLVLGGTFKSNRMHISETNHTASIFTYSNMTCELSILSQKNLFSIIVREEAILHGLCLHISDQC